MVMKLSEYHLKFSSSFIRVVKLNLIFCKFG